MTKDKQMHNTVYFVYFDLRCHFVLDVIVFLILTDIDNWTWNKCRRSFGSSLCKLNPTTGRIYPHLVLFKHRANIHNVSLRTFVQCTGKRPVIAAGQLSPCIAFGVIKVCRQSRKTFLLLYCLFFLISFLFLFYFFPTFCVLRVLCHFWSDHSHIWPVDR